ncbi:hypothetical protein I543_3215 [Mycobacteroides abscessus 21]|uniref:Uncharacterized protein n=1 Tax=Mycobacteroides abscessus 21 TaxID=1299324 RepID=A0A829QA93_9MYCO|nr:hypothetical protein I543_3215 [Mycobacteroides abscessus 21]
MTILVTGATGNVGRPLVDLLVAAGPTSARSPGIQNARAFHHRSPPSRRPVLGWTESRQFS